MSQYSNFPHQIFTLLSLLYSSNLNPYPQQSPLSHPLLAQLNLPSVFHFTQRSEQITLTKYFAVS